jgi:hypothetical protein
MFISLGGHISTEQLFSTHTKKRRTLKNSETVTVIFRQFNIVTTFDLPEDITKALLSLIDTGQIYTFLL